MRKINKFNEPSSLKLLKRKNKNIIYKDLDANIRDEIRNSCIKEQKGLCAFCCKNITSDSNSSHNAHIKSQSFHPNISLDWSNIVASCNNKDTCGKKQGSKDLPLSPIMDECETEIEFSQCGEIIGTTDRAKDTINILNLNNKKLKENRRRFICDAIYPELYGKSSNPPFDINDKELLRKFIQLLLTPDDSGNLQQFTPVLVNICNKIISSL